MLNKTTTNLIFASLLFFSSQVSQTCADKVKGVRRRLDDVPKQRNLKKGPKERDCGVESNKDKVSFKCSSRPKGPPSSSDEINDRIDFGVENRADGVRVSVNYGELTSSPDAETQNTTMTKFMINYDSIVEYKKNESLSDESEAFNWEYDEILQQIKLSDTVIGGVSTDQTTNVHTFNVTTSDGHATFFFTISANGNDLGKNLTANKLKIDFKLMDFPWMQADSYVALLSAVEAEKRIEEHVAPHMNRDRETSMEHDGEPTMGGDNEEASMGEDNGEPSMGGNKGEPSMGEDGQLSVAGNVTSEEDNAEENEKEEPGDKSPPRAPSPPVEITNLSIDLTDSPSGNSPFGSYTWAKEATIVNTTTSVQVVATSPRNMSSVERVGMGSAAGGDPQNDRVNYMAFSFVGDAAHEAKDLFWDPETSVEYSTSSASGNAISFIWLITMAGAIFTSEIVA